MVINIVTTMENTDQQFATSTSLEGEQQESKIFYGHSLARVNPIKVALGNAAAEPRTLDELRREQAKIEQQIRDSAGTDRWLRALNKKQKHLSEAIKDKEIARGFVTGSLDLVPGIPVKRKQGDWRFELVFADHCEAGEAKRRTKTELRRAMRAHRMNLNFDGTRGEIRAKSED